MEEASGRFLGAPPLPLFLKNCLWGGETDCVSHIIENRRSRDEASWPSIVNTVLQGLEPFVKFG